LRIFIYVKAFVSGVKWNNSTMAKKEETAEVVEKEVKTEKTAPVKKETKAKTTEKKEAKKEVEVEPFSWDSVESIGGLGSGYSEKEREELTEMYAETLTTIEEKSVIPATIVSVTDKDVVLNIGFKSDGMVSRNEFRDLDEINVGDEVEVYVDTQENKKGELVLSRKKAKIVKAWDIVYDALDNDVVLEAFIKRRTKGGLIADVNGIEAFLPGSQIDVKPIRDFDIYVGKKMEVKVVKINAQFDNVVVSHKVLIEKDLESQRTEIIKNLEIGQVLEGTIKNMTNFGVFIDLGGLDGLLHITDISWGRVNHPEDVLKLDEKVKVVVLEFDENKSRISLGMKQLTPHPSEALGADVVEGSKVKGKIVNVADYGAFLELTPGVEGLIHVSEMSWSQHLRNPTDFLKQGDEIEAVVLTIDREDRKMSVGIKQLTQDPWTSSDFVPRYEVGSKHKGKVRNLTNFGLFVELEEGVDGLVHVSDLSWTKKVKHPSEFIKVGEELEIVVLELDIEERRMALGHKQLEENPWDTYESVFPIGSVHNATVTTVAEKFATVELQYGVEGVVFPKQFRKEDGSKMKSGETIDFKVVEFNKGDKRIVLSHTKTWEKGDDKPASTGGGSKKSSKSNKTIDRINKDSVGSTLGDLDALTALKQQMDSTPVKEEKKKATPAKAKKETAAPKKEVVAKKEASSDDVTKLKFKNPETGRQVGYKKALELGIIDEAGTVL